MVVVKGVVVKVMVVEVVVGGSSDGGAPTRRLEILDFSIKSGI